MAGERIANDRRSMTISVALLGVTLSVVFLAYLAFSEYNNDSDASTVQFAVVVSCLKQIFLSTKFSFFLFQILFDLYASGFPTWRTFTEWSLSK